MQHLGKKMTAVSSAVGFILIILISLFQNFTSTTAAVGGNGHSASWDSRFVIITQGDSEANYEGKWQICLFKPENTKHVTPTSGADSVGRKVIDVKDSYTNCIKFMSIGNAASVYGYVPRINANGTTDSVNYAHRSVIFSMNALAIAPVGGDPMTNPFKSDLNGNANGTGSYFTYDFYLYTQVYHLSGRTNPETANVPQYAFGAMRFKVVIEKAFAVDAMIKNIILVQDWQPIRDNSGQNIIAIEPTLTADGRLMVMQQFGSGTPGALIYSYNANPMNFANWSTPKHLSEMYSDTGTINGFSLKTLYPLARKPIKSNLGVAYTAGESIRGAYPWISWEGSDVFFTASNSFNNAVRGGWAVVGESSGGQIRLIDGAFRNYADMYSDSNSTLVLFTSGIAQSNSIWNPYKEIKSPKFPLMKDEPVGLFLHSNGAAASEVSFKNYKDGRYLTYLNMNNAIHKLNAESSSDVDAQYDLSKTPDTSGNNFYGSLLQGAEIPRLTMAEAKVQEFYGQMARFKASSYIDVNYTPSKLNSKAFTVEMMVKPMVDLVGADAYNKYVLLTNIPGVMNIILEENRQLHVTLESTTNFRTGFIGSALPVGTWSHVAVTWNEVTSLLQVYVNAQRIYVNLMPAGFKIKGATGKAFIGPAMGGVPGFDNSTFILALDEYRISNVVRSTDEFADASFLPIASREIATVTVDSAIQNSDFRVMGTTYTQTAAQLGSLLFKDPRLSSNGAVSCATCHMSNKGFSDGLALKVGLLGTALSFNSPTLVNRVLGRNQTWDGKFTTSVEQLWLPFTHSNEMGLSVSGVVQFLNSNPNYVSKFQAVFGSAPNASSVQRSLGAFVASIISGKSKFDRVQAAEVGYSFTADESAGRKLFYGKARCAGCHSGYNFSDDQFHNTGIFTTGTFGLGTVTGRSEDNRKVKTPTLRHLALTAPYFHDGSVKTLSEVIDQYLAASKTTNDANKDSEMKPISLTTTEKNQLLAFLETLQSDIVFAFPLNLTEGLPGMTSPPSAPMIGTAVAGNTQATVNFSAPSSIGGSAITSYEVYANGSATAIKTGTGSPIVITGLVNGTAYIFKVKARNSFGLSDASAASNSVTPVKSIIAPTINYNLSSLTLKHYEPMTTLTPTRSGDAIVNCVSSPSLPAGLVLNSTTCAISGTPTAVGTAQSYKITATNAGGSGFVYLNLAVSRVDQLIFTNGQLILSANAIKQATNFFLAYQSDGNLVLYRNGGFPLWASNTVQAFSTNRVAVFQGDGNLVLYSNSQPYWASNTIGSNFKLIVQEQDPYLRIVNAANNVLWSSSGADPTLNVIAVRAPASAEAPVVPIVVAPPPPARVPATQPTVVNPRIQPWKRLYNKFEE